MNNSNQNSSSSNNSSDDWNQVIEDALHTILNSAPINPSRMDISNTDNDRILFNNNNTFLNTLDTSRNSLSQNVYSTIGSSLGSRIGSSLANTSGTDSPLSYSRAASRAVEYTQPTTTTTTTNTNINTNTNTISRPSIVQPASSSSRIRPSQGNRDIYHHTRSSTTNITTDPSPEETTEQSTESSTNAVHLHERFGSFIMDWMDCMNRYNNNMRQYQHNICQFNRVSSTILNMMSSYDHYPHQSTGIYSNNVPYGGFGTSATRTPNFFDFDFDLNSRRFLNSIPPSLQEIIARNPTQVEIQGISIPLPGSSETQPSFPTISQVFNATEVFTYNDETSSRVTDTRCPISLEDFEHGEELCEIRHCHHVFKWTSLQRWFSQNSHCPVCRHNIV